MLLLAQVEAEEAAAARPVEPPPPVLTFDAFRQLCLAHPLQVHPCESIQKASVQGA